MSTDKQLATVEPSFAGDVLTIIERAAKDPAIDIDKMERLLAMAERMEERNAVQQFNAAFSKMQSELPVIVAQTTIPNRGKYERFEDVMHQIQPTLTRHGFSLSFEQQADDKRITVTCHLRHSGGHATKTPFAVRLGGKADSDTQADCKASTTAKRNSLLQALNIVVRQDCMQDEDDPRNEGDTITKEQAADLRDRVETLGVDRERFLAYANAAGFEHIYSGRLDELHKWLDVKERAKAGVKRTQTDLL